MTLIAIHTRYVPATDRRGARIAARASSFPLHTQPYEHGTDARDNHESAARNLLLEAGWKVTSIESTAPPAGTGILWLVRVERRA